MNVDINNSNGGTVMIIDAERRKPGWIRRWRAFGLNFAVSNRKLKKRDDRYTVGGEYSQYIEHREHIFERQGRRCPHCGQEFGSYKRMEAHHVLPWARYPEYRNNEKNLVLMCHRCHKEVHCNPWLMIQMMQEKADELGVDLSERYDIPARQDRAAQRQ